MTDNGVIARDVAVVAICLCVQTPATRALAWNSLPYSIKHTTSCHGYTCSTLLLRTHPYFLDINLFFFSPILVFLSYSFRTL